MKINPPGGYGQHQPYVSSVKSGDVAQLESKTKIKNSAATNTDKIMLSTEASAKAEISRVTSFISAEVNSLGNAERLTALRERVQDGTYYVSGEDLTHAILDAVEG